MSKEKDLPKQDQEQKQPKKALRHAAPDDLRRCRGTDARHHGNTAYRCGKHGWYCGARQIEPTLRKESTSEPVGTLSSCHGF